MGLSSPGYRKLESSSTILLRLALALEALSQEEGGAADGGVARACWALILASRMSPDVASIVA